MPHQSDKSLHPTHPTIAKWCIWSIKNQTWLAGRLRVYLWSAVGTVAFFTFVGLIRLETALWSVFFSGSAICAALLLLIRQRKIWLLSIQAPEQRQQALNAMVEYLHSVNHAVPLHGYHRQVPGKSPGGHADRSGTNDATAGHN